VACNWPDLTGKYFPELNLAIDISGYDGEIISMARGGIL